MGPKSYEPTAKDIVINREALLNRLCALHAGEKGYEEILLIAKKHVIENFEFCYPHALKKRGSSPYDKDVVEHPFEERANRPENT